MAELRQEDGYYPRLNASHVASGMFDNNIVSLVGTVQSFDGSVVQFQCADGGTVAVNATEAAEPFAYPAGSMVELVGLCNPDNTVSLFVTREMTNDLDLDVYNRMIAEVQHNPKFAHYFGPPSTGGAQPMMMQQ